MTSIVFGSRITRLYRESIINCTNLTYICGAHRRLSEPRGVNQPRCYDKLRKPVPLINPFKNDLYRNYLERDGVDLDGIEDRNVLYAGQCPEAVRVKDALEIYELAEKNSSFDLPTAALFMTYERTVKAVKGSKKSMKITTREDFELFKALLGEKRLRSLKEENE